jgi:ligand-binding sensor domain-containing protein/signal transduction histidine kinase
VALLAAGALLGRPGPSAALDPRKSITQYGHDVWQAEDGLPQNTVRAIRQTRDGYLWLATEEGLARFDGVRFTVFDTASTPELPVGFVNALFEDRAGTLWIGSNGGGLIRYVAGRFTPYRLPDQRTLLITAVAEAGDGLWLGASGIGLLRMNEPALAVFAGNRDLPRSGRGYVLHVDRRGTLWMGAKDGGLVSLRDGALRRYTVRDGLADDHVWSLAEGAHGGLWIGTERGVSHVAADGRITSHVLDDAVRALLEDRDGNLWIGSDTRGLRRLRDGTMLEFSAADGLSNNSVWSLHEDREGSLWIGTNGGGLNRLRDGPVTTIGVREGLPSDETRCVFQHPDGTVWVGTKGGGPSRIREGAVVAGGTPAGLSRETVVSFGAGRDGALWLGTVRSGLHRWKDGMVTVYDGARGLPHPSVFALLGRPDGSVWIGHRGGGLSRLQDGRFENYGEARGLNTAYVWTIAEGRDGTLWIGTARGLYAHDGRALRRVIPEVAVHAVHVDAQGVVWAGTARDGLFRWKDGGARPVTRAQGLFDNLVAGILEDDRGTLWMSCNRGIFAVRKQQLHDVADGRAARVDSLAYDTSDGMRSAECSFGTSWRTADGRLWFPTIRGVAVVDPANLRRNMVPPPVVIEGVVANGRPLPPAADILLDVPPGEGRLHFRYTALSLLAPRKVRFAYRLEGLDADWTEAGGAREADYANLRPGHYTFRVKASNNDGVWNETGAAVRLRLRPRFHQTWWFLALCGAGVAGAGWLGHRFRLRRLLEVERVRTRIAADLHDDVGSGLSQIAILSGVARAQLGADGGRATESLGQIAGTAEELVDSMADIVWAMNPGKDHLGDLVHRMRRFAGDVLAARHVAFGFQAAGIDEARPVPPDFRRHAYLLFKEALNNAARHAGAGRVDVVIALGPDRLRIEVRDDGQGFDAGASSDGHGLETMRRRALELGGRIEITSRPGEGTVVRADLPFRRRSRRFWGRERPSG